MTVRLEHDPGTDFSYCNIGYQLLRELATRKLKKPWDESFRTELFKRSRRRTRATLQRSRADAAAAVQASNKEISATSTMPGPKKLRGVPVVWNAKDGGPTCASAGYLCLFMKHFWGSGEAREGTGEWTAWGSLPGSTAIMYWMPDGTNVVALFNGRGAATHDQIKAELVQAVKRMDNK